MKLNPKYHYLLVGHGARESAMARRLIAEKNVVSAFSTKPNYGLFQFCGKNNIKISSSYDPDEIIWFAKKQNINIIVPGNELALYNGLTDEAKKQNLCVFGSEQNICRLEKEKELSRKIAEKVDFTFAIKTKVFNSIELVYDSLKYQQNANVLKIWDDKNKRYKIHIISDVKQIFNNNSSVYKEIQKDVVLDNLKEKSIILEEFIDGIDFSIYIVTDGLNICFSPAIHDYPFLNEGNTGFKTGGMGSVTNNKNHLPFLTPTDYKKSISFIKKYIIYVREILGEMRGMFSFQFFKTKYDIKFNEIDVRPGDPEMINYVNILASRLDDLINQVCKKNLKNVAFFKRASISIYFTTPGYPNDNDVVKFKLNFDKNFDKNFIVDFGQVSFDPLSGYFTSIGSRSLVISSIGTNIEKCRKSMELVLEEMPGSLYYRKDIGLFAKK